MSSFINSIRDDYNLKPILQISNLCKSLGGADIKLLTITENVELNMDYYKLIQIFHKKEVRDRYMIKSDLNKLTQEDIESRIEKLVTIIEKKRAR